MRVPGFAAMLAAVFASAAIADDSIPIETVKQIKAATVYVKIRAGNLQGSGSGFLIKVEGDTGYLVTNNHVVTPPKNVGGAVTLAVVFGSGSRTERSAKVEVVATDPARDLAVVKVTGLKDLPKPIDLLQEAELVETLPVTAFGFPLGANLAQGKENPEITIVRGSVSSLRTNAADVVESVQIDGGLLPGNSGGPVVDNKGRLVGVVVAGIAGTSVCMAIPPRHLSEMLAGRLTGEMEVTTTAISKGSADIEASASLIDPLGKLRTMSLHYLKADASTGKPKPNAKGEWEKLPGARKVELKAKGSSAVGTFPLKAGTTDTATYLLQGSYVTADGKPHYTEPTPFEINLKNAPSTAKGPPKKGPLIAERDEPSRPAGSSGPTVASQDAQKRLNDLREQTRQRMDELKARSKMRRRP